MYLHIYLVYYILLKSADKYMHHYNIHQTVNDFISLVNRFKYILRRHEIPFIFKHAFNFIFSSVIYFNCVYVVSFSIEFILIFSCDLQRHRTLINEAENRNDPDLFDQKLYMIFIHINCITKEATKSNRLIYRI